MLTLVVTCPAINKYVHEFTINAADIAELVEAPNDSAPQTKAPTPQVPTITVPENKFEDPAILSMGKKPMLGHQQMPEFPQWGSTATERADSLRTGTSLDGRTAGEFPALTPIEPLQQIYISEVEANSLGDGLIVDEKEPELSAAPPVVKTKRARRRKGNARKAAGGDFPEPDVTPAQETSKSKGWRQTPLLEPNPSFQPFSTLKKNRAAGGGSRRMEENGWATEDATDVQDLGDFNFAESLAKFDKKTVFTQIQAEDNIADEDRLVAHNRLPRPKPGTAGGKNLHYTENVLDVSSTAKTKNAPWRSEVGDSDLDERTSQRDTGSGKASRRGESKLAVHRRPISRLGSVTGSQPPRTVLVSHPLILSSIVWILLSP